MSNVLIHPNSGIIEFNTGSGSNVFNDALDYGVRILHTNTGGVGLISYNTGTTSRFYVEGFNGRMFEVVDDLSGSLMSVNDIAGLPVLEVFDNDRVVMGTFGSNALVVSGNKVGIGTGVPQYPLHVTGLAYIGAYARNPTIKTAPFTVSTNDDVIIVNSSSGITGTLVSASVYSGRQFVIKNKGTGTVTIDATSLGQIDGANTYSVAQYVSAAVVSDGSTWNILTTGGAGSSTSGTSGNTGTSGTSGAGGTNGTSGAGGTNGTSGAGGTNGTSGTSGINGTSGTSGENGTSGLTGADGSSGTSGATGGDGTSGTSGAGGTNGTSGANGGTGSSGTSGANGTNGTSGLAAVYIGTSTDSIDLSALSIGSNTSLTTSTGLSYSIAQHLIVSHGIGSHFHGDVVSYNSGTGALTIKVLDIDSSGGAGPYSTWTTNLDGAAGGDGTSGTSGAVGSSGTSGAGGTSGSSGSTGATGSSSPRAFTLENPEVGDDFVLWYTNQSTTLTQVKTVLRGTAPTGYFYVRYDADRGSVGTIAVSGSGITNTTTGINLTLFNQPIPDNNWVWIEVSGSTGNITELAVTFEY